MFQSIRAASVAALIVGGLASLGCTGPGVQSRYQRIVDPCQQERYKNLSRDNVLQPFDAMANNANTLDATLWNNHFEPGKDTLNASGLKKIDYIARRLPVPTSKVWIQTARDLPYDAAAPQKLVSARADLDAKRCQAVLAYLSAQPNAQAMHYDVQAHDAVDPSMPTVGPTNAYRGLAAQYGASAGGTGGAAAVAGAGGGAAPGTPAAAVAATPPSR
jgi:hypothetical protein